MSLPHVAYNPPEHRQPSEHAVMTGPHGETIYEFINDDGHTVECYIEHGKILSFARITDELGNSMEVPGEHCNLELVSDRIGLEVEI